MSLFNEIQKGFQLGVTSPVVMGQEDWLYIYNRNDWVVTFSPTNPLIVTGFTPVSPAISGGGPGFYKFTGTNNDFKNASKLNKTIVGPRFTEEIDFVVAGNSSDIKATIMAGGYGRLGAICINNFKATDAAVELFGANNGLIFIEADKNEASEGGWTIKLGPPDKLMEPYPPRSVSLTPISGAASYANTVAMIEALVINS